MEKVEAAAVGGVIGLLYGIVLMASYDAFSVASFVIYGDPNYLPLLVAVPIAVLSIVCALSYPLWIKPAQNVIAWLEEGLQQEEDELE